MAEFKKAMLSQPMAGKTDDEIVAARNKAINALEGRGYEIVNTLFTDEFYSPDAMKGRGVVQIPLAFLAKSLTNMSLCHAAYFCKGWEKARGCRIEHEAAKAYGLEIIYEEEPEMSEHKNCVTQAQINELMANAVIDARTVFDKCTQVTVRLENGFIISEASGCVDPANYDFEIGKKICLERIENKLWELEGYALQKKRHEEGKNNG